MEGIDDDAADRAQPAAARPRPAELSGTELAGLWSRKRSGRRTADAGDRPARAPDPREAGTRT